MLIPDFDEANAKVAIKTANPLDRFVFDNEPDGTAETRAFREGLQALVDHLTGELEAKSKIQQTFFNAAMDRADAAEARVEELGNENADLDNALKAKVYQVDQLLARVAELEDEVHAASRAGDAAVVAERERIIAYLGTAFLGFVAHDPQQHLFMVGTENIRRAIESMP